MSLFRCAWIGPTAALALACGGWPGPKVESYRAAPASPSVASAPVASTSSEPSALPVGATAALTFHLVNETHELLSLLKLAPDLVIATGGDIFSKLDENGIALDERQSQGLPSDFMMLVSGLAGRYPDALWASVVRSNGRVGRGELYRRRANGWSREFGALPEARVYLGLGTWQSGRVIALEGSAMGFGAPPLSKFKLISGDPAPLPVLTPAPKSGDPDGNCAHWGTALVPALFTALPSGHVFVAGSTCDSAALAVEAWSPGSTKSALTTLADSSNWFPVKLLAASGQDVWLLANGATASRLLHFDGASWQGEALPFGNARDFDRAPDGSLFAISTGRERSESAKLWWRPAGTQQFSELPVPPVRAPETWSKEIAGPTSVAALSADDVWLVVGPDLFHSHPPPQGPHAIEWAPGQQFPGNLRTPKPATAGCSDVFVLLYAITAQTPPNYDFPLTRQALAGHTEFAGVTLAETEDNGRRFIGAFVKDFAQGEQLSKLVRDKVKGSVPSALCAAPKRVREIAFDWRTGKLLL